jgi:hypothetical protein
MIATTLLLTTMNTKTTIKRILKICTITLCLGLIGIAMYIYATPPKPIPASALLQLARLDMDEKISAAKRLNIINYIKQLPAIKAVVANEQANTIVYTFNPTAQDADSVAKKVKQQFALKAHRFTVSANQLASGCPVQLPKDGFWYRYLVFIKNLV